MCSLGKCSNDHINSEISSDIPSKYVDVLKKEWKNHFSVNISTGPIEMNLSGSNMGLICTSCKFIPTGSKTPAFSYLIGGIPVSQSALFSQWRLSFGREAIEI